MFDICTYPLQSVFVISISIELRLKRNVWFNLRRKEKRKITKQSLYFLAAYMIISVSSEYFLKDWTEAAL